MARKRSYRSSKAYTRKPANKRGTSSYVAKLGNQSTTSKSRYSSSVGKKRSSKTSNIVEVRYTAGTDNLQVVDKVSKEELVLKPGDQRTVHMNKTLVKTLESQGFEFEVM